MGGGGRASVLPKFKDLIYEPINAPRNSLPLNVGNTRSVATHGSDRRDYPIHAALKGEMKRKGIMGLLTGMESKIHYNTKYTEAFHSVSGPLC